MNPASSVVSGERRQRDCEQEGNVNPGEMTVGTSQVIELGLLADPENPSVRKVIR